MNGMGPAAVRSKPSFEAPTEQQVPVGLAANADRYPGRAFVMLSVSYFVVALSLSSFKLLWLDELITVHLARLSGLGALWDALARGADPNPPITYMLVHWSRQLLGNHEFAYRLPDMIGYWIGVLSLFAYLKERVRGSWAIFGCLVSMCMGAFEYSYESRSYAIFYGLAMLAFLCWTISVQPGRLRPVRWAALAGMVAALAAGISTNYFAVLAFLPPAAGELVRTIMKARRRSRGSSMELVSRERTEGSRWLRAVTLPVWVGFAVAASPILIYRPLIAHSIAQFAPYAWNKVSLDQVFDSYTEMVEVILFPILALLIVGVVVFVSKRRVRSVCGECRQMLLPDWAEAIFTPYYRRAAIPPYEAAGVLVFMCYPICGYVIASIKGGMLSPRFVIPVCFGFAIAAAIVAEYIFRNLRHAATIALCLVSAWFLCREAVIAYWYKEQQQSFYKLVNVLEQAEQQMPPNSPIAIPDPLLALTFHNYAPDYLADREVFPIDFPAIRYYRHDDSPEENLWAGRRFLYELPIMPLADFQSTAGKYLIIASPGNWMLEDLRMHRYLFRHMPIPTGAEHLGGFTPLARGTPSFYVARGAGVPGAGRNGLPPAPFQVSQNLPQVKWYAPPELLNDE